MTDVDDASGAESITEQMMQASYATVALNQRLPLDQISQGATERRFPMRDHATPDWFAAAAGHGSSLSEIAPELQVESSGDQPDWDLIRMYAPELNDPGLTSADQTPLPSVETTPPKPRSQQDRDVRIDLLAELRDVDE